MSNVVLFEADNKALAISASLFGDVLEDFGGVSKYPTLSLKGRQFTVHRGREAQVIQRKNADGDLEQVSSINAVLVRVSLSDSRAYYKEGFKEGVDSRPACFSDDDVTPDTDSSEPQSKSCAMCPHNAWGSNKDPDTGLPKGKACRTTRRVAVAPLDKLDDPMLLRVPTTSIKTIKKYIQMLTSRGFAYPAVITRISFTPGVAFPSVEFEAKEPLSEADAHRVHAAHHSDLVQRIVGLKPAASEVFAPTPVAVTAPSPVEETPAPTLSIRIEAEEAPAPVPVVEATPAKPATTAKKAKPSLQIGVEETSPEDAALREAFTSALGDEFDDIDL